jgi:hypothetical protein
MVVYEDEVNLGDGIPALFLQLHPVKVNAFAYKLINSPLCLEKFIYTGEV